MGRGRAKAKQQKVARELKYNSQSTDLDALQRELAGYPPSQSDTADDEDEDDLYDGYDDPGEEDDWRQAGR